MCQDQRDAIFGVGVEEKPARDYKKECEAHEAFLKSRIKGMNNTYASLEVLRAFENEISKICAHLKSLGVECDENDAPPPVIFGARDD